MTPSASMLDHMRAELRAREPFARMRAASLDALVGSVRQTYYAPGETVLWPQSGVVQRLAWVRRGTVVGHSATTGGFQFEAGEMFPLGAVMGERAVTSTYEADGDLFCLEFDAAAVRKVVATDPVFADYVNRRLQSFLTLSRAQLQAAYSSQVLAEQSFDAQLATLPRRAPVAVAPGSLLHQGLARMQERRVGSVMVLDDDGGALGILTRHDLLARIALHEPPLDIRRVAIAEVMTTPVQTIDVGARVHDAAILMSRYGIRHVPITEQGRVVSIISERDLFALQRLSLKGLSASLRHAPDVDAVRALAPGVREFARHLLAQGLAARTLTALVSHLNDLLGQRLVELTAARHGLDLSRACWLAFGSEGRGEQTIATDQDNGLVLADEVDDDERSRWLAFGREVNQTLDACGYPLCKGGVMAGNEDCCLRLRQWHARFERWIDQGAPEDLLNASIYFDLRPLAGNAALAAPLREFLTTRAGAVPRFLRQLAENSLRLRPALNWRGAIDTQTDDGREWVDLKMNGTAVFVDAARLFALAKGIGAVGTRERLTLAGEQLGASESEREGWASAFEVLQMMRLRIQVDAEGGDPRNPNRLDVAGLNEIDRHLLKESLQIARRVQQRVQLDWMR